MMVPRSFKYGGGGASPPQSRKGSFDDRPRRRNNIPRSVPSTHEQASPVRPVSPARAITEPVSIPSKPVDVPDRTRPAASPVMSTTRSKTSRSVRDKHRADALSPSVAALLAMTAIPPLQPHQFRLRSRRTPLTPHLSIDELVNQWKSDDTLPSSVASSPSLSILLGNAGDSELDDDNVTIMKDNFEEPDYLHARSTSSDSVPSLDADRTSLMSVCTPSTPGSVRSRRSISNLKKERSRSSPAAEDCALDHPLNWPVSEEGGTDEGSSSFSSPRNATPKPRSGFRSNLTTSLQALKAAALNSFSSLASTHSATFQSARLSQEISHASNGLTDEMLWSHPFLFPRYSSEIRPTIQGTPTQAQRRYLNPMPLTFEEQEAPFQQALHAPYLAEPVQEAPLIQLQTYNRGNRRGAGRSRGRSSGSQTEAGRALQGISDIRQREPRENSDFLRVVVLEMNMRRQGKLETGRAKIWLPPRQISGTSEEQMLQSGKIPTRWVGVSAS